MKKNITPKNKFDIAVIGGGPAGIMATGNLASKGLKVALIEKNKMLGKKLLLTGKGKCNLTNFEKNPKKLAAQYGKKYHFILPALFNFGVEDTIKFFENLGVKTKVERGNRVFPKSDRASDILRALENWLKVNSVELFLDTKVFKFIREKKRAIKIITSKGEIEASNYIIATGGLSYPDTGSTGDGFQWAKKFGHNIEKLHPALVGIKVRENWIKDLQGLSLKNVNISIHQPKDSKNPSNYKKLDERFGDAIFTDIGMSGPIILDMSKKIGELLENGICKLLIDFKPALDFNQLDKRLLRDFKKFDKKMFKNSLKKLLPSKLIPIIITLSKINPDKRVNKITSSERNTLLHLLKELELTVDRTEGFEKAIITSGGVDLREIDPSCMKSKLIDNLYFIGEVLDFDGPTGGYNLQMCWSTGKLVGKGKIF